MKLNEGIAIIEAIMFACAEPISVEKLAAASGIDEETTAKLVDQLERRYNVSESGLRIIRINDGYQITTRVEYAPYIKEALECKRQTPLSQAAMETLAIVAYNQPVTKAFIEQVRGIDSGSVVNTLVERELLEEAGRLDLPGRPVTYRTSETFLRCFGIATLDELPPLPNQSGQLDFEELEELERERAEKGNTADDKDDELDDYADNFVGNTDSEQKDETNGAEADT